MFFHTSALSDRLFSPGNNHVLQSFPGLPLRNILAERFLKLEMTYLVFAGNQAVSPEMRLYIPENMLSGLKLRLKNEKLLKTQVTKVYFF